MITGITLADQSLCGGGLFIDERVRESFLKPSRNNAIDVNVNLCTRYTSERTVVTITGRCVSVDDGIVG